MPAGVIKSPEDEKHWAEAKKQAEKQGRKEDWPYVMGIFQKMSGKGMSKSLAMVAGDLRKSTTAQIGQSFVLTKWPGQVPSKENIDLLRMTKEMPSEPTLAQMFSPTGAYLSPDGVLDGLGLDNVQQAQWKELLGKALHATNELVARHEIMSKMLADRMQPELRKALFQRALSYYRDMRKSMVSVVTVDELRKGDKPGQIVDKLEQGDPEDRLTRIIGVVSHRLGNAGPEGLSLDKLSDVVKTYGQPLVAQALNKACAKGGSMLFKKGLLQLRGI